ncbi:MAG: hypothetical protein AAFR01_07245, partial [Pseudomonadota bacterium]
MGSAARAEMLFDERDAETDRDDDGAFLAITQSVRGFRWRERLANDRRPLASAIAQQNDMPELLGRVLAARGFGLDDVEIAL